MAIIKQKRFFSWEEIEDLGDLERLKLIINYFDDEKLMQKLEKIRDKGRNKYPIRATWNSILAGIIYQHDSINSLIRELKRNIQLRDLCGFDILKGIKAIPTPSAYSNFLKNLMKNQDEVYDIFNNLIKALKKELPDLGEMLAGDGKAIPSYGKKPKRRKRDGRRDMDANIGVKTYSGIKDDGTRWQKTKIWFGYRLHLIVDAKYEIPVAYEVTKASISEKKVMRRLIAKLNEDIIKSCKFFLLDKGYDDVKLIKKFYDGYKIKPIIDIRNMWKDPDQTRVLDKNIVYNYKGTISCYCPVKGEPKEMAFKGFEESRKSLKYICPSKAYGIACAGVKKCLRKDIRIPLSFDRRIFTPVARSSYKWKTLYKKRTSVERVNSRIDQSFGFERHFIRGLKKMKLRCGLALCVMLTLALARIKEKRKDLILSLVKVA